MADTLVNGDVSDSLRVIRELDFRLYHRAQNANSRQWDEDEDQLVSKSFQLDVVATKNALFKQTNSGTDGKITIDNDNLKTFSIRPLDTDEDVQIKGTYHISNLLQELTLAEHAGQSKAIISGASIVENPVDRIRRRIRETFWTSLTRRMDKSSIAMVAKDTKVTGEDPRPRIYVPETETEQYEYYSEIARQYPRLRLDVQYLPKDFMNPYDHGKLRLKPGILALDMSWKGPVPRGLQYVVPGGRFNELYGWDSYFICLGLLEAGEIDLVRDIVYNFIFMIHHYGAVLNANRTYYLGRAHPPFLTDLVLRTYAEMDDGEEAENLLRRGILTAIKEYHQVWVSLPRYDPITGLSRYRPGNHNIPPEVEEGHYDWFLRPHAENAGMTIDELSEAYISGKSQHQQLDEFFSHDWAVRESGHDTSYRVEAICADLATIDLNSLLYKYETDIAWVIENGYYGHLDIPKEHLPKDADVAAISRASYWTQQAEERKISVNKYLWNSESSRFHDYNTATSLQTPYESITTFWALWSGLASEEQAEKMVKETLPKFETIGGAVSTTPHPDNTIGVDKRPRQWDFPFGWAPHQITLWDGLRRYGFNDEAKRLAYKWLYLITSIAVDYNGMVLERYDVTKPQWTPGKDAEYENQGTDFEGVPMEGFGWTNASYVCGLNLLDEKLLSSLRKGIPWEEIHRS